MPRFDVYPGFSRGARGYVVDVQADALDHLSTRVIVPLLPFERRPLLLRDLNPVFDIEGEPHSLEPQSIATVPRVMLKRRVTNLSDDRDAITRALDTLLTGF